MVTKAEAMNAREFHYGDCTRTVGPRGGVTVKVETWRRSGATKTWVTRPTEFRVPVKFGLYQSSYIDDGNAHQFHAAAACPLDVADAREGSEG